MGLCQDDNLDLLKFNYEKLHESIRDNHKTAWTVTSIYIPVIFAVEALFVEKYVELGKEFLQVMVGVIGMEFLLLILIFIMRIFDYYNDVRRERLKEIEYIFDKKLSQGIGFKQYSLDYSEKWKKLYFSAMTIYLIFFGHIPQQIYF